jgi:uncharacterized membrane protein affecting hemolysin expression
MRDDENRRTRAIILVLVIVVILLLGVIAYFLGVKPLYNAKQMEAYNSGIVYGQNALLSEIIVQIQQTGFVQIPLNENQTLYLAPFDPSKISPEISSE